MTVCLCFSLPETGKIGTNAVLQLLYVSKGEVSTDCEAYRL